VHPNPIFQQAYVFTFATADDKDKIGAPLPSWVSLKDKRQPNRDPEVSLGASRGTSLSPAIPPISMQGRQERR
jgi:hypothetical protein